MAEKKTTKKPAKKKDNEMLKLGQLAKETYEAFVEAGFNEEQAFELLIATLKSPAVAQPRMSLF